MVYLKILIHYHTSVMTRIPSLSEIVMGTFPFTVSLGSAASTVRVKVSSPSTISSSATNNWRQASDTPGGTAMEVFTRVTSPAATDK